MTLSTPWESCFLIHWDLILWILHFKLADILNLVFISAELKLQLSELQQYLGDQIQHSYYLKKKKKRRELGSLYEQGNLTSGGNLDCCFGIFYEWSRSKNGREPTFKIKPVNPIHDRFNCTESEQKKLFTMVLKLIPHWSTCVFSFKRRQKLTLKNCQWQDPAAFVFLPRTAVRSTTSGHHRPAFIPRDPSKKLAPGSERFLRGTPGFPGSASGKEPPANAGDIRDAGSIPGSGRSPGGGHGKPLQFSCLENPTDRGAWQAKSRTHLRDTARIQMHMRLLITTVGRADQ